MLFHAVIILAVCAASAAAETPSAYRCAPGKPVKGAECSCPSGHRPKRDADNVAICIALATPSVSARFVKAVQAGNLAAAADLARKYDLHADRAAGDALGKRFKTWSEGLFDKLELLASRGQCSAIDALLAPRQEYEAILRAFAERYVASSSNGDTVDDLVRSRMATHFKPLDDLAEKCIATASRDDGTPKIAREYRAHHRELAACLQQEPERKSPLKVLVVVDAEGKVVRATIQDIPEPIGKPMDVSEGKMGKKDSKREEEDGKPMDLSEGKMGKKDSDGKEGTYRMKVNPKPRNECIEKVVRSYSFKPNARGFAATVIIAGPGMWPTSSPDD